MTRKVFSFVAVGLVALALVASAGVSTLFADASQIMPHEAIELAGGGTSGDVDGG